MNNVLVLEPNKTKDIKKYAKLLGISVKKAQYIEHMREHYMCWEHDYVGNTKETE